MSSESQGSKSPEIKSLAWGRVEVEHHGTFKDVKLFPGGARSWDWTETGTSHSPGIQMVDAEELVDHGASVVVLGTGMLGRLQVSQETLDSLGARGIEVHVERTEEAVRRYNELRRGCPVGALLHSTC